MRRRGDDQRRLLAPKSCFLVNGLSQPCSASASAGDDVAPFSPSRMDRWMDGDPERHSSLKSDSEEIYNVFRNLS